jgi:hypothetical protein
LFGVTPAYVGNSSADLTNSRLNGYISNFRIVRGTAIVPPAGGPTSVLTAVANTVFLTAQSTSIIDNSSNNVTISQGITPTVTTFNPYSAPSVGSPTAWTTNTYGSSLSFDGTGDYVSANSSIPGLAFGTGDFTIEFWVYFNTLAYSIIIDWRASGLNGLYPMLYIPSGSTSSLYYYFNSGDQITSPAGTLKANVWHHVALTRATGSTKLFVDGVQVGSTYADTAVYAVGANRPNISASGYDLSLPFNGYMSNLRVTSGVALYKNNFIPSKTPLTAVANTSLLINSTPAIGDSMMMNSFENVGNTKVTAAQSPYYDNHSVYFNGSADSLTTAVTNSAFDLSTGNWTIEAWVYPTTLSGSPGVLNLYATAGTNSGLNFWINSSGVLNQDNGVTGTTGAGTVLINTWTHIAAVRTSSATQLYVNGVAVGATISQAPNAAGFAYIGRMSSTPQYFTGYISNVRVVKGTAITPIAGGPTSPLTAVSGTSLLTCKSNRFIDNSTANTGGTPFNITTAGTPAIKPVQPFAASNIVKLGSMSFDGTGDWLPAQIANTHMALGTSDFTIEMWIYPTISGNLGFLNISPTAGGFSTSSTNTIALSAYYGNFNGYIGNNGSLTASSGRIITNAWNHFAVVRSSGVSKVYINGVLETTIGTAGSIADTYNYTATYMVVGGYYSTSYPWQGYIADLRITKGVARYTTAFTPTTTPLLNY